MTGDRDFERIARAWLDSMPSEAPDRLIDAVHQAVETTPQRRHPLVRAPWRSTHMTRFALIAATAALGAALLGGALYVGGIRLDGPTWTAPPLAPTASPAADSSPAPAPESLRANWLAGPVSVPGLGTGEEVLRLVVATGGAATWVQTPEETQTLRSITSVTGPDELTFALVRPAGAECPEGASGRYRWAIDGERTALTLTVIEDPCPVRAEAYARTWTRTHTGFSDGGTAVVPDVGPLLEVTLPAGSYTTRPLIDVHEIQDIAQEFSFLAFRDPQAFADPCVPGLQPWSPGARAFVDALRRNPAMTDFVEEQVEVGGYPTIHLTLMAAADHPKCEPDHPFYQWTAKRDPGGFWWLSGGDPDSMYVVDHPDATMLFQVFSSDPRAEAEVVATIRFLDALPTRP